MDLLGLLKGLNDMSGRYSLCLVHTCHKYYLSLFYIHICICFYIYLTLIIYILFTYHIKIDTNKIYIISVTTNIYQKAMPSMKKLSYF